MNLDKITVKGLLFNPKEKDFDKSMIKRSEVFNFKDERINAYIILAYDLQSEFRRNISEYLRRKTEVGDIVGFKRINGYFEKKIEDMLVGQNEQFNKAVVQYVSWMFDREYKHLVVLEFNYVKLALRSFTEWDTKINELMTDMKKEMEVIETKLFGGEEVTNMRKALYSGTERTRLRIRVEDVLDEFKINGLEDWSPYGDYKPEPIKFVGDKIPKK
jgi:hypothetical protein